MKVSKSWLQELVEIKDIKDVERLLPLRTIATREITEDFIELDMKGYNRADLLSMRGVAREVAAITDSQIKFTEETDFFWSNNSYPETPLAVEKPDLCPIYCLVQIEGLRVEKSSSEWVQKLLNCGMRSVNNIADVTNLIMLEYGQPLHSFDADTVDGNIIVRTAKSGEKITTLDGKVRNLEETDLLIADSKKALGIAGVMGGANSEITDSTQTILLEAAIFEGKNLRRTVGRLHLQSEAGKRFQHGLTKTNLLQALHAAIKMYEGLGGKVTAISMVGDTKDQTRTVQLRHNKVKSLIGVDVSREKIESSLERLGFSLATQGQAWEAKVPYWRLDIEIEEDLIEEVARMYGYENIPANELEGEIPEKVDQSLFEMIYKQKTDLVEKGFTEIQTYSFVTTNVLRSLLGRGPTPKEKGGVGPLPLVKVANPMSSETEYLRTNIWPNLIEVVDRNIKQGFEDIAIFEIGKVYLPADDLPKEEYRLAIALMNGTDNPIEELISMFRDSIASLQNDISLEKGEMMEELKTLFHPTRFANIKKDGEIVGKIAEVHPRLLHQLGVEKRVAIVELSLSQ